MHRIRILLVILMLALPLAGCDDDEPKPTYYNMVYRTNSDGTLNEWEVHGKVDLTGAFACWKRENGGQFCISGVVTIVPVRFDPIIAEKSE
jgi:hypothetical protein